jgi:hypothetical protein
MTSSSQLQDLDLYLARHRFAPNPGNSAWLDRNTGQQIIRVLYEPGGTTLLFCLGPHRSCLYEAVFSPGTPETVIIAAIEAALSPPRPRPARAGPGRSQAWPAGVCRGSGSSSAPRRCDTAT